MHEKTVILKKIKQFENWKAAEYDSPNYFVYSLLIN